MPKPNFADAKRQRELAKKQNKEDKQLRKAGTEREPARDGLAGTAPPADALIK
jgi:hypothetical protein